MILSRTMRPSDYQELQPELAELDKTIAVVGPVPYTHRRWEYALILRAVKEYFGDKFLQVADFGCEAGLSPALMLMYGHDVTLYEIWAWGNKEADARDKANRAIGHRVAYVPSSLVLPPMARFVNRPLGGLLEEDKSQYDLSLCISVIEHIADETAAFNDLLDSVRSNGMAIVTMDFAPVEQDTLYYHWLRSRIYNEAKMNHLVELAKAKGFKVFGDLTDWSWAADRVMVQNEYGFSSLVVVRE